MAEKESTQMPNEKEEIESAVSESVNRVVTKQVDGGLKEKANKKDVVEKGEGCFYGLSSSEVIVWCLYGMCSYFIHTVLIPIVFPLMISQITPAHQYSQGWGIYTLALNSTAKEHLMFDRLTNRTITVYNYNFSPLEWTSISWGIGLIVAAPILGVTSTHIDNGNSQPMIATAATFTGFIFCLVSGFFKTVWVFPPFIAAIVAASLVAATVHMRHLGVMVCRITGPTTISKTQFQFRRTVAGWLSLYATIAGALGATLFSSFTYHMLGEKETFLSLWIVSIFSGLIWLAGLAHFFISSSPCTSNTPLYTSHPFSILKFPHAIGSLIGIFLSSLTTMCIFTSTVLYLVGDLYLKPKSLLYLWTIYFLVPLASMPLVHLLQYVIKANAVKMQILGFLLSTFTSGIGFYFKDKKWQTEHILILAVIQSISVGLLHAFGRVVLLDCCPFGKEGAFSSWFLWIKVFGSCVGFAVASTLPEKIATSFGIAFCSCIVALVILIFGNISDFGGAIAAGHVKEDSEEKSHVSVCETVTDLKQAMQKEV